MSKILILGSNGMAGHVITTYLCEHNHNVTTFTRTLCAISTEKNILWDSSFDSIEKHLNENNFDYIVNCVGILNLKCDENKFEAIKINSLLPHFLAKITLNKKTKVIHLSTDCVFSGEKGRYVESDYHDGKTFYDKTKSLGEFSNEKDIVFRNSIIGPNIKSKLGNGLFDWIMLNDSKEVNGFDNWYWSGVTTLELAKKINFYISNNFSGIYQLTNNEKISKYHLLKIIQKQFDLKIKINKSNLTSKIDKSTIDTRKISGMEIASYEIMILELFEWINNHPNLYKYGE
ncbi:MAG: SDR family oxidoreductase [Mycoplasma sp.]